MDAKSSKTPTDTSRQFLRHTLATVAYRGSKALRGAPNTFAEFRASDSTRSPAQILVHIGDLYDWALSQAKGQTKWSDSKPLPWEDEVIHVDGSQFGFPKPSRRFGERNPAEAAE